MDKGEGAEFQGKTLQEIDVQLEVLNNEVPEASDNDSGKSEIKIRYEITWFLPILIMLILFFRM